ncbi:MAG: LLM class flavin-dependent oxidoreductase [Thiovulaceae bacterium]|nr:LLM class flavin-dependent oxidoreductase [Sulfurimonadaceae bacterium]
MKVGLFCLVENFETSVHKSIKDQIALVELAEELGFDEAWFGEHHFNGFSVIPDPALMISYAAARTTKIRLGTAGFLAPFYEPIRLAESINVLDNLCDGRLDAGFAKGGFAADSKHFLKNGDELRELMFESVEAIDVLINQRLSLYHKKHISFHDVTLHPKPFQEKVPFYIATFSSPQTIKFAALRGYGLMVSQGASIEDCVVMQELYKSRAGYYPQIVLLRVFCVADMKEEAINTAKPTIDYFVKSMRAASAQTLQPRWDEENYKKLLAERVEFFSGENFFKNAILGNVEDCIQTILEIKKEVKNLHLVLKPSSSSFERNYSMLKIFNTKIKPNI